MKLNKWVSKISGILGLIILTSIAYADAPKKPQIFSVSPEVVDPGGELTITGEFLGDEKTLLKSTVSVEIDGEEVKDFYVTKAGKEIKVSSVVYPDSAPKGVEFPRKLVVSVNNKRSNAYPFLQSANPLIVSVVPDVLTPGDKITLTGNFVVLEGANKEKGVEVRIDDKPVDFLVTKPGKEIVIPRLSEPKDKTEYKWQVVVLVNDKESNRYIFPQQKLPTPIIFSVTPKKISQGDTITIKGNFLPIKNVSGKSAVKVRIDGQPIEFVTTKPGEEIKVVVGSSPADLLTNAGNDRTDDLPKEIDRGEYERSVTVEVDGQQSDPYHITHLTWGNFCRPHVFIPMLIYLAVVLLIIVISGSNPFKSATDQLSLSKIQMGAWTLVFGFAYTALSAIWLEFLDITEGMFWLMGISSATAVGAKAIVLKNAKVTPEAQKLSYDFWKSKPQLDVAPTKKSKLEEKVNSFLTAGERLAEFTDDSASKKLLKQSFPDYKNTFSDLHADLTESDIRTLQQELNKLTKQATEAISPPSTLLKDWESVSQQYSLSLHRCQIALWTLIVLCLFLTELVSTMHLPDIPDKLLVLMGISGGTYLGFNYPKIAGKG